MGGNLCSINNNPILGSQLNARPFDARCFGFGQLARAPGHTTPETHNNSDKNSS